MNPPGAARSGSSGSPAPTSDPAALVRHFLELLASRRAAEAVELLAPGIEWRNTGLPTVRGKRVGALLRDMDRRRVLFDVTFHHLAADGEVVLTDRVDTIGYGRWRTSFWVCGTFHVEDGRIAVWDDHFSAGNVLLGSVKGLGGLLRR